MTSCHTTSRRRPSSCHRRCLNGCLRQTAGAASRSKNSPRWGFSPACRRSKTNRRAGGSGPRSSARTDARLPIDLPVCGMTGRLVGRRPRRSRRRVVALLAGEGAPKQSALVDRHWDACTRGILLGVRVEAPTAVESAFFDALLRRVPQVQDVQDWYHMDSDGSLWMTVSVDDVRDGDMVVTWRCDYDGHRLLGGASPAFLNWDDGSARWKRAWTCPDRRAWTWLRQIRRARRRARRRGSRSDWRPSRIATWPELAQRTPCGNSGRSDGTAKVS